MKKFLTITSRSLFVLVLLFCIFKSFTILADTTIFQITKIEVKEKSEGVVVNDVSLSNGSLNNDIIFSAKDDFVKYNITIKNNTSSDYIIKTITDNNESTYLEYTYDNVANTKVEGKSELTFELQIKYVNETSGLYISNEPVSLTLTYEKDDGTTSSETITDNTTPASDLSEETEIKNPNTGDNLNIYIIIGLISLAGLGFTFVNKKSYFKTLMFIGLFSILAIPFGAKADSEKFVITFTTNKIQNTSTDLISGPDLNLMMFKLCTGNDNLIKKYPISNNDYFYINNPDEPGYMNVSCNATHFVRATKEQYHAIKDSLTGKNIISISDVDLEAYMWYDESTTTLYYYSSAIALLLNEDSSSMFRELLSLTELNLDDFDTVNVTDIKMMFNHLESVTSIDLGSHFDTSNVTDMSDLFRDNVELVTLNLGDKFDTSNVTNMSGMFSSLYVLPELDLGDKFDTSKVTDMSDMFTFMSGLSVLDLGKKFDTSNVTNMNYMFYDVTAEKLYLGDNFNTSNVTNMNYIFGSMNNLKTIYTKNDFDLSSDYGSEGLFEDDYSLVGGSGIAYGYDGHYDGIEYANISSGYFTYLSTSDDQTYSNLISGPEINLLIHSFTSGYDNLEMIIEDDGEGLFNICYGYDGNFEYCYSNRVSSINFASKSQYEAVKDDLTDINVISTPDSDYPTYLWYDENTWILYFYTEASQMVLNEDSSFMFANLTDIYYLDLSRFNTSHVTNMSHMFHAVMSLVTLNLGDNFDTSNVTNMDYMFYYLDCITTIYVTKELDLSSDYGSQYVFKDSFSLIGGAGTGYDENHVDSEYARIDDPEHDRPGYFTLR